jgi:hypothetical protein
VFAPPAFRIKPESYYQQVVVEFECFIQRKKSRSALTLFFKKIGLLNSSPQVLIIVWVILA